MFENGAWGAPISLFPHENDFLKSVSCVSSSFCAAVNAYDVVTYSGGSWIPAVTIDGGMTSTSMSSVSCASEKFCAAVDSGGKVVTYDGKTWSASPLEIDSTGGLSAVSCKKTGSTNFCAAVEGKGGVLTYKDGKWSERGPASGGNLLAVSCASESFCVAGGQFGYVREWEGTEWSAAQKISGSSIDAVSCASTSFCAAVDNSGNAIVDVSGVWSTFAGVDSHALVSVSCPSAQKCVAVDAQGDEVTYTGAAVAECATNTGTVKLAPGLTNTAAVQAIKIKGRLAGCTGEPFTEVSYKATLETAGPVSCSTLTAPDAEAKATGEAKYKWTPKAKPSTATGPLSLVLSETPSVALFGEATAGSFSPLTFSGTASESYEGGPKCDVPEGKKAAKAVKKGTFTGTAVSFE